MVEQGRKQWAWGCQPMIKWEGWGTHPENSQRTPTLLSNGIRRGPGEPLYLQVLLGEASTCEPTFESLSTQLI